MCSTRLLDLVELAQQLVVGPLADRVLDLAQLPVPAEDARADAERVERRQHARERDQHGDDRHQHRPHAVDQVGEPERQVALQHRRAARVEALRLAGERSLGVVRVREVALLAEPAGAAVHLLRRLDEELDQRRMGVLRAPPASRSARPGARRRAGCRARGRRRRAAASPGSARGSAAHTPRPGRSRRGGCPASAAASGPAATRARRRRRSRRCWPSSRPTTAGVCGSRTSVIVAGSMPIRLEQPSHQVGDAAAGLADVDAPACELREARQLGRLEQPLRRVARGRTARPARRTGCRARPGRRRRRRRRRALDGRSSSAPPCTKAMSTLAAGLAQQGEVLGRAGGLAQPHRRCRSPSGSARSACRTRRTRPGPGRWRARPGAAASGRAASRRAASRQTASRMNGRAVASRSRKESRVARSWSRMARDCPCCGARGCASCRYPRFAMRLLLVEDDRMIGESLRGRAAPRRLRRRLGARRGCRRRHARERALRPRPARPRPAARRGGAAGRRPGRAARPARAPRRDAGDRADRARRARRPRRRPRRRRRRLPRQAVRARRAQRAHPRRAAPPRRPRRAGARARRRHARSGDAPGHAATARRCCSRRASSRCSRR